MSMTGMADRIGRAQRLFELGPVASPKVRRVARSTQRQTLDGLSSKRALVEPLVSIRAFKCHSIRESSMHGIIYLVGLVVVVLAVLSLFGLR